MELSLLLLEKILSMALMVLMGFAVVRLGAVKAEQSSLLSSLTLYIIVPCMILSAFQVAWTPERLSGLLLALIAAVLLHILYIAITRLLGDRLRLDGVERASLIYSNGGNLIVPLVSSVLGEEYVFYCCAFIAFQTILLWAHLPGLLGGSQKLNIKKLLLNPNILAIIAGVACFLLRITFPPVIAGTIDSVSATIGPVAMFMIGMLMADTDLKATFTRLRYWGISLGRLVVYPVLFVLLIALSRVTTYIPMAKEVLVVTVLAASAPVAVSVAQMADLWGGDAKKAGAINVMSVILCIATMPLIIALYQAIC